MRVCITRERIHPGMNRRHVTLCGFCGLSFKVLIRECWAEITRRWTEGERDS